MRLSQQAVPENISSSNEARKRATGSAEVAQFSLSDIDERCSRDRLSGIAIVEIFPTHPVESRALLERESERKEESTKAGTGEEKEEGIGAFS